MVALEALLHYQSQVGNYNQQDQNPTYAQD